MVKTLLSLLLVVTQVVPWTASPLFLCVGSDGSVCLDGGPAACACCRDREHEEDACCAGSADNARHEHRLPAQSDDRCAASISDDDCDCAHVLLSRDARVIRRMRVDDDALNVTSVLATFTTAIAAEVSAPTLATTPGMMCRDVLSLPLSERAPVVLRC
jgi:hypothetical protein